MVKNPSQGNYGLTRLKSKNARNAIIQKLAADFNLTPLIAEAYYQQFELYFKEHANIALSSGQISYEAIAAYEPASKHIRLAQKVSVKLKLIDFNSDLDALAQYGLSGLRRHRLARLCKQAYDQNALLSYEDLAMLLTTSPATIKRDIYFLRRQGMFIVTRGMKHDMGPGLSHKTIIIDLYFKGYTFSEIEQKTNHSEKSVLNYLSQFARVITLHQQGFPPPQIRMITKMSDRLVKEYLQLLSEYQDNDRLSQLANPAVASVNPTKDTVGKRGVSQ